MERLPPRPIEAAGKTELFPGFELWNRVEQRLIDYHGYDVRVIVQLVAERYEVELLEVTRRAGGEQITGFGLRRFTFPAMLRHALEASRPDGDDTDRIMFGHVNREAAATAKDVGPTDESLRLVARVYRAAYATQEAPNKAVQDVFGLPPRTAGDWIRRARDKGLIPAEPRAGDNQTVDPSAALAGIRDAATPARTAGKGASDA